MNPTFSNLVFSCLLVVPVLAHAELLAQPIKTEKSEKKKNWFLDLIYDDDKKEKDKHDHDKVKYLGFEGLTRRISLIKEWRFSIGDNDKWISPGFDDSHWEKIKVPSKWENEGFHGYDGYAWYRANFDGRALNEHQTHFLMPGIIDDADATYLNGELVGKSGRFPPKHRMAFTWNRKYYIPTRLINFGGDNLISVRVYDHHGEGGIIGGKPGIYSSFNNENLLQDLYGTWKFKTRDTPAAKQPDYDDTGWNEILVPSRWDDQGYRSYDGVAWYRKHFDLCFEPEKDKNYYLLLGRIDDFDVTYLNGREIGATFNKTESWKTSRTWEILRVYKIPANLLRTDRENVIAVKVTDVSGPAGIYQGPIGIIEEEHLTRTIRK